MELSHKRVLILGLGRFGGGGDAAQYAARQGADVCVTDQASAEALADSIQSLSVYDNVHFRLGSHDELDVDKAEVVIVNPAVPDDHPLVLRARRQGKVITHAVNLFLDRCPGRVIGITGANGKSTTAALTAHLLEENLGKRVWLSGNIGHHPLLGLLDRVQAGDLVVLELSSFQTERLNSPGQGPEVALLTNLTPNHLDRHGTFTAYCAAKEQMFRLQPCNPLQPCLSLFCAEDEVGRNWYRRYRNQPGRCCLLYHVHDVKPAWRDTYTLPGHANQLNLAGAAGIARYFGLSDQQIQRRLLSFQGLPHRLQYVAESHGVRWYNDSIATTPESTQTALQAFADPKVLIAGGYDKGISFTDLGRCIADHAKVAILLGRTAPALEKAIRRSQGSHAIQIRTVTSLEEAVDTAKALSQPGDVVLLSPACASYDMFDNFQQRGEAFIRLVQALAQ